MVSEGPFPAKQLGLVDMMGVGLALDWSRPLSGCKKADVRGLLSLLGGARILHCLLVGSLTMQVDSHTNPTHHQCDFACNFQRHFPDSSCKRQDVWLMP